MSVPSCLLLHPPSPSCLRAFPAFAGTPSCLLLLFLLLAGCGGGAGPGGGIEHATGTQEGEKIVKAMSPSQAARPQVNLSIYHLSVPVGTVSRSDPFWKHVNEDAIDIATRDLLDKNGLRVGRAPLADIDYFLDLLERGGIRARPIIYAATGTRTIDLLMKKGVQYQIIYHWDARGRFTMRSYDDADNLLCVEFEAAPRRQGDVRISMCPMVRSLRRQLVATGDVAMREIEYITPEKYFDLNLRHDIPLDSFLVLAPSRNADADMSLGGAFLVREGNAEKYEDVLLIIPMAVKTREGAGGT